MRRPGLLAVDLDGTLLGGDGRLAEPEREAVRRALAAGIQVAAFTGRNLADTRRALAELPELPAAVVNGALVVDGAGRVLRRRPLPPALAAEVVGRLRRHGGDPLVYLEDNRRYYDSRDPANEAANRLIDRFGLDFQRVPDLAPYLARQPLRVSIWQAAERIAALEPQLARDLTGRVTMYIHPYDGCHILELLHAESTKESALAFLAARLGVAREAVAAVGDGVNDAGMLRWAGLSAAPANGLPAALAAAGRVIPANTEHGVAVFIDELVRMGE